MAGSTYPSNPPETTDAQQYLLACLDAAEEVIDHAGGDYTAAMIAMTDALVQATRDDTPLDKNESDEWNDGAKEGAMRVILAYRAFAILVVKGITDNPAETLRTYMLRRMIDDDDEGLLDA